MWKRYDWHKIRISKGFTISRPIGWGDEFVCRCLYLVDTFRIMSFLLVQGQYCDSLSHARSS